MRILDAGRLCEAIRMGMSLLYYGDLSERRMVYKLTARGMERAVAQKAAHYLCERGLLQETESAVHRARQSVRKGWGRRRIADDLRAHGYADGAIEDALVALEDVDFEALCAEVIRKKYRSVPDSSPTGRAARQKMIAALLRLGFSMDEVRHAMHTVMAEKANT